MKTIEQTKIDNKRFYLSKDRPYFIHDPEGDGFTYYATEEERDEAAKDIIQEYLDDGWNEEVESVTAGKITHQATQVNVVKRPHDDELDEDGFDKDGQYWDSEYDYTCGYELRPLGETPDEA